MEKLGQQSGERDTEARDGWDDLVAEFEAIEEYPEEEGYGGEEEEDEGYERPEEDFEEFEDYEPYEDDGNWDEEEDGYEEEMDGGEERVEELERERQFETFTLPKELIREYDLPRLPKGVAIMGGTARSVARRVVTGDAEPVRDLDLVYIPELDKSEEGLSEEELEELSKEYMPDDYMNGHGIQTEELENYFLTRDFTINQCLVYGDQLVMTRAAYDDFQENIIRPSYDTQPYAETPINQRLFLKALMMQTVLTTVTSSYPTLEEFNLRNIDEEIEERERFDQDDLRLNPFEIALTMNKVMSRGAEVATRFVESLIDYDVVDEYYWGQPLHLAREARDRCYSFEYRPLEDWEDDELEYDSLEEEFAGLENFQTHDPAVRKAMSEYRSGRKTGKQARETIAEKKSGEYSAADYQWANGAA